jgi:hypothetical protein
MFKVEIDIEKAHKLYLETGSVWKAGEILGVKGSTLHNRLKKAGLMPDMKRFLTPKEEMYLRANYSNAILRSGGLDKLAEVLGKPKTNLCRHARKLGLTTPRSGGKISIKKGRVLTFDERRPIMVCEVCGKEYRKRDWAHRSVHCSKTCLSASISKNSKEWIAEKGHPKGMLGKNHTEEFKQAVSKRSTEVWASKTEDEQSAWILNTMKGRLAKYGTLAPERLKTTWKQGWREIGGKNKYYRSRWEANYARYLDLLKGQKQIAEWEHEPETFWFEEIKRGCRSYLPDFRVTNLDGSIEYHEVKGWFDDRSKTKLKRMAKYHPHIKLRVIAKKEYSILVKQCSGIIKDWE